MCFFVPECSLSIRREMALLSDKDIESILGSYQKDSLQALEASLLSPLKKQGM